MESMTAERLQQEIDGLNGNEVIMIYGRIYRDSKFPDFWKIDHCLNGFYTISGPDFLTFGEKLEVRKNGPESFEVKITNGADDAYDIIGYVYMKNVYQVNILRHTDNTAEASA